MITAVRECRAGVGRCTARPDRATCVPGSHHNATHGCATRREATSARPGHPHEPATSGVSTAGRGCPGGVGPHDAAPHIPRSAPMKGDRVEIVIDAGSGTTRTYEMSPPGPGAGSGSRTGAASSRSPRPPAAAPSCGPRGSWPTACSRSWSTRPRTPRRPTRSHPPCAPREPRPQAHWFDDALRRPPRPAARPRFRRPPTGRWPHRRRATAAAVRATPPQAAPHVRLPRRRRGRPGHAVDGRGRPRGAPAPRRPVPRVAPGRVPPPGAPTGRPGTGRVARTRRPGRRGAATSRG